MSPRTGRTTDDPKHNQYKVRLSDTDMQKLDYAATTLKQPKAEVIRQGINLMYAKAQKKQQ